MKLRSLAVLLPAALAFASPASASFSGGSSSPPPTPSSADIRPVEKNSPRQDAERSYADGYDEVAKAKKDLAAGKAKNAEKRFKKAIERGQRAVDTDSTYHEAWNLVGYCARKLGDYDRSLAAYTTCLRLKPDYVPAREYLGEAYVELGKVALAREQLSWLERLNAPDQVTSLRKQIDDYMVAHPEAKAELSGTSVTIGAAPTAEAPVPAATELKEPAQADTATVK